MNIEAVILAGGKSRRMNFNNKSFLDIKGKTFIERIIEVLEKRFDDILIVSNDILEYEHYGKKVFGDIYPGKGPMSGIHSALKNTEADYIFVVATDMPLIDVNMIDLIMESTNDYDIVVPSAKGKIHPLCGIYSKRILEEIELSLIEGNYRLMDFLLNCRTSVVNCNEFEKSLENINTPDDYSRLELK